MLASLGPRRPAMVATWLALLASGPAWAAPTLGATPDPITLEGGPSVVRLEVRGLSGRGAPRAAVNVGQLEAVGAEGEAVVLRLRTPVERHPQRIVLIVWREGEGFHALRAPMLGRTLVPIRTRRDSTVTVAVGERSFGPFHSKVGRLRVPLLVPPGVTEARLKVVDSYGLESEKRIAIAAPDYNLLTLALDRRTRTLAIASADPARGVPAVELNGREVQPRSLAPGLWSVSVPDGDRVAARAWLPGQPLSTLRLEAELRAPPSEPTVAAPRADPVVATGRVARTERRWAGVIGVGAGFAHSLGAFVSPRFTLSLGVELRPPVGWLGLRGLAGVSWGGQREVLEAGEASSKVLLLPLGAALTYRIPFRVLTPYAVAGCLAQVIRTQNQLGTEERLRHDVAMTVLSLLGAERELGAGLIFLEGGYQWSRLENEDVQLLAGGLVLEAGYRFRF